MNFFNPFKIKPIKTKKPHFNLDTDRDNVPDFKDCRPFNPRLQHVLPNKQMRKEIKKLPFYVEDYPGKKVHVMSKEAKKIAPKARQELLSSIKKYPQMITDIRRIVKYNPNYEYVHSTYQSPLTSASRLRTRAAYGTKFKKGQLVEVKEKFGPLPVGEKAIITSINNKEATIKVEGMEPHMIHLDVLPQYFRKSEQKTADLISEADRIKKMDEFMLKKEREKKTPLLGQEENIYQNPFKTSTPFGKVYESDLTTFYYAKQRRERERKVKEGLILPMKDLHFKKFVRPMNHTYEVLVLLSDGKVHRWSDVMEYITGYRDPGSIGTNQLLKEMSHSGLIKKVGRGKFKITDLGRIALTQARQTGSWSTYDTVPERTGPRRPAKRVAKNTIKYKFLKLLQKHNRVRYQGFVGKDYKGDLNQSLALRELEEAGLIRRPKVGLYELTTKGRSALKQAEEQGTWINPEIPKKYNPTINKIMEDIKGRVINIRHLGPHEASGAYRWSNDENLIIFDPLEHQDGVCNVSLYVGTNIPNRPYRLVIYKDDDGPRLVSYAITEPERQIRTAAEFLEYIFNHIEYSDVEEEIRK